MKKISIMAISIMAFMSLQAQDTIYGTAPKSNYLTVYKDFPNLYSTCDTINGSVGFGNQTKGDIATGFYSKDPLVVYGIAGAIIPEDYFWDYLIPYEDQQHFVDTTCNTCTEAMRLYQYNSATGDMTKLGEDLWVHVNETPVTYYQKMTQPCYKFFGHSPDSTLPAFPVYEKYFSQPQVVSELFFVGYTQQNTAPEIYDDELRLPHKSVAPVIFTSWNCNAPYPTTVHAFQRPFYQEYGIPEWRVTPETPFQQTWFLFTILTPNPHDTTHHAGDSTLFTGMERMLERVVAVSPNPATEEVTVACSVGLMQVEVYNPLGRRIMTENVSGMTCRFNVKGWAKGVYTVVVATPIGMTTKKLLVK